ncbi:EamA family transporter RarD [Shewanella sp. Isolate8]|uniref:EamA family transporter RarD n=1 Tax=Shewanella sp. Isolate8 TaxID=2908529 RepID=UPI001EFDB779|nr:EamA family transporter RarD [Shewanella sp. Isolate8]MCG9745100.1 EamA family transporter RarD [Shewanella sp. Isolate8]
MPSHTQVSAKGNALAIVSFLLWGLLPLYYQFLPGADISEMLAIRLLCSVPFMLLVFLLLGKPLPSLAILKANLPSVALCALASVIMCVSWYSFTWALTHGQVLAASLGFFINPLFAIGLGVIFLKDRLSVAQKWAVMLGGLGIAYMVMAYGQLPWLALLMGSFFALYGLCKKYIHFDSLTSVTIEAALLTPIAAGYLLWLSATGQSEALSSGTGTLLLYIGSAPVTLLPLIFFALAIRHTSLSMVGLLQYIEPSMHFLLAIFLFNEAFDSVKAVSFALIWLGLILCSLEALPGLWRSLANRRQLNHSR